MATVGHIKEMKLHAAGDDSQRAPLIPVLFEPKIETMNGNRMLFSGLERQGDQSDRGAATVWQEWAVEIMAPPPAELAETSHRPGT